MIGKMTYNEVKDISKKLTNSSQTIRTIIEKYDDLEEINDFCNSIEAYSQFINSTASLYIDSDYALKTIIEKNK